MAKSELNSFVCTKCGYASFKWMGRCPSCNSWNSFEEETVPEKKKIRSGKASGSVSLLLVSPDSKFRFSSRIDEFDRVLGGGIVRASSVLIGGEPGIGKSTLMLRMAAQCDSEGKVVYVCGEESPSQVRQRADRLGLDLEKINIFSGTKTEDIENMVRSEKPQLLIIDSLQTLESQELASVAGSVTQIKACCMAITSVCRQTETAVFFIGHVTKEGAIAGPKVIEHVVDTVVYFEEGGSGIRIIRAAKNRFGSVDEIGIFRMTEKGLEGVSNPSGLFISQRDEAFLPPGIAYTAVSEGSRTFLVEIQALVVRAKSGVSRVYSDRIDASRIMRIAAILERHAGMDFADKDIYINVAGGIKVNDVSVELSIAMALCSAFYGKGLGTKTISFGELSLAGEIRTVNNGEKRLKAAADMGFESAVIPAGMSFAKGKIKLIKYAKVAQLSVHCKPQYHGE